MNWEFSKRSTPKGCWAIMVTPSGREVKKFFRNGYMLGQTSADNWIDEQKKMLEDERHIREGTHPPIIIKVELTSQEAGMLIDAANRMDCDDIWDDYEISDSEALMNAAEKLKRKLNRKDAS